MNFENPIETDGLTPNQVDTIMMMHSLSTSEEPRRVAERLQAMFSALVSATWPPFAKWRRSRRDHHNHFGSLDDQTLADIGLKRSEMRAAEYGIMPSHQTLTIASDQEAANDRCPCC
jgi:uncharacterized protein YjiS (DUF1127 family)